MNRRDRRFGLWLVMVIQGVLVAHLFRAGAAFLSQPTRSVDYSFHFYEATHAAEHLRTSGSYWGYDPFWMSGYNEGLVGLIDNKAFLAIVPLVPRFARAFAFNAEIFAMLLSVPLLGYAAGRIAWSDRLEATLVALAGIVVMFAVPLAPVFWAGGAISFFFASSVVVPAALGIAAALEDAASSWRRWFGWVAAGTFAVGVHAAIAPMLLAPLAPVALMRRGSRATAKLSVLGVALGVALWPAFAVARFARRLERGLQIAWWTSGEFLQADWTRLWDDWVGHCFSTGPGWTGGAGGLFGLAVFAAVGAWSAARGQSPPSPQRRARTPVLLFAPWCAAILCFALAYGGSAYAPLRIVQPYRFLLPFAFFLAVPAGRGAAHCLRLLRDGHRFATVVAVVAAASICESALSQPSFTIGPGVDRTEDAVVEALRNDPVPDGRVLVESLWTQVPAFDGASQPVTVKRFALLPLEVGRECVGYTGTGALSAERFASFAEGRALGRDLARISAIDFDELLRRYAISSIVACSVASRRALARFADVLEPMPEVGECQVLRVRRPEATRVLQGAARVVAHLDRIEVGDAVGEVLVLKYHWSPTLRTVPAMRFEEAPQPGAAIGFIAVHPEGRRDFAVVAANELSR